MTWKTTLQIGDYVIEGDSKRARSIAWLVRMVGAEIALSFHATQEDAKAAVKRYQAADQRHNEGETGR